MPRIVLISDTHSRHSSLVVPDGDILVHAGDLTNCGSLVELREACEWLNTLPHKHKIAIAGNHDFAAEGFYKEKQEGILRTDFFKDVIYLRDSGWEIDGLKFWGSPWTPEFFDWAFNLPRGEALKEKWDLIPANTNVLITHGPPAGILDTVRPFAQYWRTRAGCDDLAERVWEINPEVHVFGHIHSGYGSVEYPDDKTNYYNASNLDEAYRVRNAPIVLDLELQDDVYLVNGGKQDANS